MSALLSAILHGSRETKAKILLENLGALRVKASLENLGVLMV